VNTRGCAEAYSPYTVAGRQLSAAKHVADTATRYWVLGRVGTTSVVEVVLYSRMPCVMLGFMKLE
jgi:hypothetical protein